MIPNSARAPTLVSVIFSLGMAGIQFCFADVDPF